MKNSAEIVEAGSGTQRGCYRVIPAEAGIQALQSRETWDWTPAFAGVTTWDDVNLLGARVLRRRRHQTSTVSLTPHCSGSSST